MAARIFLYLIAIIIVLVLLAGIAWSLFQDELLEMALVPSEEIEILEEIAENAYADSALWLIRPDIENPPSDWMPDDYGDASDTDADDANDLEVAESSGDIGPDPVSYTHLTLPTTSP